ncbi:MAG: hypothetical protein Q8Q39_05065 [bacterium]|nr:hypothetical protein [bacterium]
MKKPVRFQTKHSKASKDYAGTAFFNPVAAKWASLWMFMATNRKSVFRVCCSEDVQFFQALFNIDVTKQISEVIMAAKFSLGVGTVLVRKCIYEPAGRTFAL